MYNFQVLKSSARSHKFNKLNLILQRYCKNTSSNVVLRGSIHKESKDYLTLKQTKYITINTLFLRFWSKIMQEQLKEIKWAKRIKRWNCYSNHSQIKQWFILILNYILWIITLAGMLRDASWVELDFGESVVRGPGRGVPSLDQQGDGCEDDRGCL